MGVMGALESQRLKYRVSGLINYNFSFSNYFLNLKMGVKGRSFKAEGLIIGWVG